MLAKIKYARPTHTLLKNGLAGAGAGVEAEATLLPHGPYCAFLSLSSSPAWYSGKPVLPIIFLMCFLGITKGGQSHGGQPSGLQGRLDSRHSFPYHLNISWLFSPTPPNSPLHEGSHQKIACLQTEECLRKHKLLSSAPVPTIRVNNCLLLPPYLLLLFLMLLIARPLF